MASIAAPAQGLDIGRLIDRTYTVYVQHIVLFVSVAIGLGLLPSMAYQYAIRTDLGYAMVPELGVVQKFPFLAAAWLSIAVISALHQGLTAHVALTALDGGRVDPGASAVAAFRRLGALVAVFLIVIVTATLGAAMLIVPGIIVFLMWCVASQVVMAENVGVAAALSRSRALTRGARLKILAVLTVVYLVGSAPGIIIFLLNGLAAASSLGPVTIAAGLWSSIATSVLIVGGTALYVELRQLSDGTASDVLEEVFA